MRYTHTHTHRVSLEADLSTQYNECIAVLKASMVTGEFSQNLKVHSHINIIGLLFLCSRL